MISQFIHFLFFQFSRNQGQAHPPPPHPTPGAHEYNIIIWFYTLRMPVNRISPSNYLKLCAVIIECTEKKQFDLKLTLCGKQFKRFSGISKNNLIKTLTVTYYVNQNSESFDIISHLLFKSFYSIHSSWKYWTAVNTGWF